jgi:chaperonin GroES
MKIRPLGNRVLVIPDKPEETTRSGIYYPIEALRKPKTGVIKAVGEGDPEGDMILHPGEHIIFDSSVGSAIEVEGVTYLIMRDKDVLATYLQMPGKAEEFMKNLKLFIDEY